MRFRYVLAWLVVSMLPQTSQGRADPGLASAREYFRVGLDAARHGDWPRALASFTSAYQIAPRASVLFNLAGAQARCGKLLASNSNYRRLLASELTLTRPQRSLVEQQIAILEARTPRLRIQASGLDSDDRLLLDQTRVYPDELGREMWVDPGVHQIQLFRERTPATLRSVVVVEGEVKVVALTFP